MPSTLSCGTHGEREARFVCDHLFVNHRADAPRVMRYFAPAHGEDEPMPAIWCEDCEGVIMERGEVDDTAADFANFRMVCDFCFQAYLDANVPGDED